MPPEHILQEAGPKVYTPTDPDPSCTVPVYWELVNTVGHRGLKRSSCLFPWSPLSFPIPAGLKTQTFPLGCVLAVLAEKEQQESAPLAATGPPQVVSSGTPVKDLFKYAQTVEGAAKLARDYRAHVPAPVWKRPLVAAGAAAVPQQRGHRPGHSQFQR